MERTPQSAADAPVGLPRPNRTATRKHTDHLDMAIPKKAAVRFRERAELLDFLLEVSRVTSETLDLDKLLANVGAIVKDVVPYDLFAILLVQRTREGLCASATPSAIAKRWCAAWSSSWTKALPAQPRPAACR